MKRVIGILLLSLIVLVFAVASGFTLLTYLFYVLALALAGSYVWAWLGLRWLDVRVDRRSLRVQAGQPVDERITIRNRGWVRKPWLEVVELTDMQEHHSGMAASLPGKAFRSWRALTHPQRRGVFHLGPLRITSGDPFGLFRMEREYAGVQEVLVLPKVVPLPSFFAAAADLPGEGPMRQRAYQLTPHAAGVREHHPDDGVARIHWPTTAKRGHLMVKEFDLGVTSDVWLLLDLEGEVQAQDQDDSTDELAVVACASMVRHFIQKGLPVGVAINSQDLVVLPADRGYVQDSRIMEALARAKAGGSRPLEGAITELDPQLSRRTTLLVITPSARPSWVAALGILAHRSVRIRAVLVDGASFGGSTSPNGLVPPLSSLSIPAYLISKGDDLRKALGRPVAGERDPIVAAMSANGNLLREVSRP